MQATVIASCLRQRRCGRLKKCFLRYGGKGGERVDQKFGMKDESQCAAVTTSGMKANAPVSLVLKRNNHMRNAR